MTLAPGEPPELPDEALDAAAGGVNGSGTIRFAGDPAMDDGLR